MAEGLNAEGAANGGIETIGNDADWPVNFLEFHLAATGFDTRP